MSSMMPSRFHVTMRTHAVFAIAHDLADRLGRTEVTPLHVLLAIVREGRSPAVVVLHSLGVRLDALEGELEAALEAALPPPEVVSELAKELSWTASDEQMLKRAEIEARELGHAYRGCEHLLLAFLRDNTSAPAVVLAHHDVCFPDARAEVLRLLGAPPDRGMSTSKPPTA